MASSFREGGGGGRRSSSSGSNTSTCAAAPVSLPSSHTTLDLDCTDCGSFLFGQRGRLRSRPHGVRSHHHSRANSTGETGQTHAQRLLLVGPSPVHHPFANAVSQHLVLPQNEQLSTYQQGMEHEDPCIFLNRRFQNDTSDLGSLQGSDDDGEEVSNDRVLNYVACHGREPGIVENINDVSSTLAEIFRCFICLGKVVDAQLCPCCSKLVCQPCIKRWLTDQKSECPHCRAPLLVSQLVSCRFISEISLEVEKIQGKLGDNPLEKYCPTHDSPLLYFCTTCSVAVCSDCAVLIEDHRNHIFEKLSVAYGRHKKKIRIEAAGLRRRRKELSALVASVDKNIESVLKSKDESAADLQVAFKRMQSRLEEQLKCKLLALLAQKGSMTQEMELLDTILHELDQQLNSIPKSDLIAQEPNMSRMLQTYLAIAMIVACGNLIYLLSYTSTALKLLGGLNDGGIQDIRTRTFSDISRTSISPDFTSEVVPAYEFGELILKNYKSNLSQIRPTVFSLGGNQSPRDVVFSKDLVFSEPVCASGIAWRLKVYPNGSGASQGTHLSVFLEMVEGGNEPATYEYGIELLHRNRLNQRVVRKFSSDFEVGACWGYYQFFRIDLLEKEGYLHPEEDTITLRFYVRPLTYQQQCQDLRRALAALQVERDESATQVAVIRRAFAATFFQRRRRRSNRAIHADGQASFAHAVAGAVTNLASPNLGTRKSHSSSIKHFHMKMQEYGGSKAGKWLPGVWLQADGNNQRNSVNLEVSSTGVVVERAKGTTSPTHPTEVQFQAPFGEQSFADFMTRSEDIDVGSVCIQDDGEATPVEHVGLPGDNRSKERREIWLKKRDDFFQSPTGKVRLHKKLRNRKAHKFLLAPEALPFIDTAEITHQLSVVSVEAGPSETNNSRATPNSSTAEQCLGTLPSPVISVSDERKDHSRERYREGLSNAEGYISSRLRAPDIEDSSIHSGRDEENKSSYLFPSTISGLSVSYCTPEIEDWGNLK